MTGQRVPSGSAIRAVMLGALIALAGFAPERAGANQWMSAEDLRTTFAGTTIDGAYASGMTFREQYFADGTLDYREQGGRMLTGRWSVVAATWCTIYTVANTGGCFKVRRMSANCYEFHFQTRTEAEAASPDAGPPNWTARAWLLGAQPTCREAPIV